MYATTKALLAAKTDNPFDLLAQRIVRIADRFPTVYNNVHDHGVIAGLEGLDAIRATLVIVLGALDSERHYGFLDGPFLHADVRATYSNRAHHPIPEDPITSGLSIGATIQRAERLFETIEKAYPPTVRVQGIKSVQILRGDFAAHQLMMSISLGISNDNEQTAS